MNAGRRFLAFLIRGWSNWLLAFLLAVMVWMVAEVQANPNRTQRYPFPVPLEVRHLAPGLDVSSPLPKSVEIYLRAPQSVWDTIISTRNVRAYIDLEGLGPGTYTVPVQVEVPAHPVRIVDYNPREVEVTLEEYISKEIPVTIEIQGDPATGYRFLPMKVTPPKVTVKGPKHLVEQVDAVKTRLYVQDLRSTLERWLSLQAYDAQGRPVEGVVLEPKQVYVVLPVEQLGGYREVSVRVHLKGQPAPGYYVSNIEAVPQVVTLFSPDQSKILEIPGFVETEPVDITGITDDLEVWASLVLPEGVQVVGDNKVLVRISVKAIESSIQMELQVEVVGLKPDYVAEVSPKTVTVTLLGPVHIMKNLRPESVRAFVDVSDKAPGAYEEAVQIEILLPDERKDQVRIESLYPDTVEVTIQPGQPGTEPTVTPTSPTP